MEYPFTTHPSLYAQLMKSGTVEIYGADRVFIEEINVFAAPRHAVQAAAHVPPI